MLELDAKKPSKKPVVLGTLAKARAKAPLEREPRTLREEQQRATREKLIQATFTAFSSKNFHEATINDIVALAKTSRATFYLHFASKSEALAAAWVEVCQPRMHQAWHVLDAMPVWDMPSLCDWHCAHLKIWEDTRSFHIASNQAVASDPQLAENWNAGINAFLQDVPKVLARFAQLGFNGERRFVMLCHLLERSAFTYLTGHFQGNRDDFVREMASFWYQSLNQNAPPAMSS